MTVADLRDIVDYFRACGDVALKETAQRHGQKVKGVKIHYEGDQKVLGVDKYITVEVPRDHPIFIDVTTLSSVSNRIELPILTRKYPASKAWANAPECYDNQAARFLHMNADPDSQAGLGWGWAPAEWQNDVGSVLVVRADGKDPSPQQGEALCDFCQSKLQPLFEESLEGGISKEEVLKHMTKDNFEHHFVDYRARWLGEDPRWAAAQSPYLT